RPRVPDGEPQDVSPLEHGVRDEDLAGRVYAVEERAVLVVGRVAAGADEREVARRDDLPARLGAHPVLEEVREPYAIADRRLEPFAPVAAEHRPELERPEAAAERRPVVGEVLGLVGAAQVLRDEAER